MTDQAKQGVLSPFLQRKRLEAAAPYVKGRVLDIGCGNGSLAALCDASSYLGVDRAADALATARRRFPEHRFVSELPAPNADRFDSVIALAVIEHISDPGAALSRWSAYMEPGGVMVLTTPHPSYEWVHEAGAQVGLFSADAAEEHEEMIDLPRMKALLEGASLTVEQYRRFLFGVNQLFVVRRTSGSSNA